MTGAQHVPSCHGSTVITTTGRKGDRDRRLTSERVFVISAVSVTWAYHLIGTSGHMCLVIGPRTASVPPNVRVPLRGHDRLGQADFPMLFYSIEVTRIQVPYRA